MGVVLSLVVSCSRLMAYQREVAREARLAQHKLPIKTKIVSKGRSGR